MPFSASAMPVDAAMRQVDDDSLAAMTRSPTIASSNAGDGATLYTRPAFAYFQKVGPAIFA